MALHTDLNKSISEPIYSARMRLRTESCRGIFGEAPDWGRGDWGRERAEGTRRRRAGGRNEETRRREERKARSEGAWEGSGRNGGSARGRPNGGMHPWRSGAR